jgi:hypothetical protein
VSAWIVARIGDGIAPGELIALTRSFAQLDRATAAVKAAGQEWVSLADWPAEDSYRRLRPRHLLHVACIRALNHLAVTGAAPDSGFLADLVDCG